jgi:LacI family transcriptional regulator
MSHSTEGKIMRGRATVKEIARLTGVSIGTVDRVLHDRGGVAEATKRKVNATIKSLGYEPDILARQLSLNKDYTIRVLMPRRDQDSGYWNLCLSGIEKAQEGLAPYRVKIAVSEFDGYDSRGYQKFLDSVLEDPGDGLFIAPVFSQATSDFIVKLDGKTPYAFFDGVVKDASPVVSIRQDPYSAGYLAAKILSLVAKGKGPLVALNTHEADDHIAVRIDGFSAYLKEHREKRPVLIRSCPEIEQAARCSKLLQALFKEEPGTSGILVANASGHFVAEWLARNGRKKDCALVCWDLVPANERALRDGNIDAVISQRPFDQVQKGIDCLYRAMVGGERDDTSTDMPLEVFFKESLPA